MILIAAAAGMTQVGAAVPMNGEPQWRAARPIDFDQRWRVLWFPDHLITGNPPRRVVHYRVTIRPDGKPRNCEIEKSSGDKKVDWHTCNAALQFGNYVPARWIDGTPTYGIDRKQILWTMYESVRGFRADMDLTVNKLPNGLKSPQTISVDFAVDESGRPIACGRSQLEPRQPGPDPELVAIVCQQVVDGLTSRPAFDEKHRRVHSVQSASVRFVVAKP